MFIFSFLAVLLAIAVPTFTAQKDAAISTQATANVKQVVNAIESCATSNTDGSYTGCLDAKTLQDYEAGLRPLTIGTGVPATDEYQVAPIGSDDMGYLVQAAVDGGYFAELHFSDGRLLKLCGPTPFSASSTEGDGSGSAGSCHDGTW